jgi:hypothetical protein
MSAIPIIGDVIDAVGDVVEFVGDVVEDVVEVVGDVVDYVAENPEIVAIVIAAPYAVQAVGTAIGSAVGASAATTAKGIALATQPVTAAAVTASQGGSLEDIGKAALGSLAGQAVGIPVAKGVGNAIGATGNAAQTALANAVGGAVGSAAGAAVTGQDIGEAALMGAAGSAGASLARSGAVELGQQPRSFTGELAADIGEAAGRTAAGGDLRQELVGAAFSTLDREGRIALEELKSRPQTERTKQIIAAFSEPRAPGVGKQLGEATAGLGMNPVLAEDIEGQPVRSTEVIVTPDVDTSDVRTGRTIPSSLSSGKAKAAGTTGGVRTTATGGMGAGGGAGGRAPEEMTGAELLESAATGEETQRLPEVEVEGEIDFTEFTDDELIEYLNQQFPLTEPEPVEPDFQPMDVRPARGSIRRAPPSSISPRAVGTSPTAAIVGDKEPIFGGEPDQQQDVWNTRSLRLRKALGG